MVIEADKLVLGGHDEMLKINKLLEKLSDQGIQAKKKKFNQTELMDEFGYGDKIIRVYIPEEHMVQARKIYDEVFGHT